MGLPFLIAAGCFLHALVAISATPVQYEAREDPQGGVVVRRGSDEDDSSHEGEEVTADEP